MKPCLSLSESTTSKGKRKRPRTHFVSSRMTLATSWVLAVSLHSRLCIGWISGNIPVRSNWVKTSCTDKGLSNWNQNTNRLHPRKYDRCHPSYSSSSEDLEDFDDPNSVPDENQLQLNLREVLKAERRAESDDKSFNAQEYEQNYELPDFNPLKRQVEKNAAMDTLSASLAFPDYESKPKASNSKPTSNSKVLAAGAATTNQLESQDDDDSDGFYLAPDIYQRSRDLLHGDGSLDLETTDGADDTMSSPDGRKAILERLLQSELESNQVPAVYDDIDDDANGEEDWNEIWATVQNAQTKPFNASQSEELHRQVFEGEEGYLQQTEKFRQSLTDPSIAEKANYERRSAQFLDRQAKALEKLNRNMEEFEPILRQRKRPGPQKCSRCSVKLVEEDFDVSPQLWMQQRNLTRLCRTCYINMMETSRNLQKLQPKQQQFKKGGTSARNYVSKPSFGSPEGQGKPQEEVQIERIGETPSVPMIQGRPSDVSSWTEAEDPDTGETFYMSEEHGDIDIRWDI